MDAAKFLGFILTFFSLLTGIKSHVSIEATDTNVTFGGPADLVYHIQMAGEPLVRLICRHQGNQDSVASVVYRHEQGSQLITGTLRGRASATLTLDVTRLTITINMTKSLDDGRYSCEVTGNATSFLDTARLLTYTPATITMKPPLTENGAAILNATVLEPVVIQYNSSCSKPPVVFTFRSVVAGQVTETHTGGRREICNITSSVYRRTHGIYQAQARLNMVIMVNVQHPSFPGSIRNFNYTVLAMPQKQEEDPGYRFRNVAIIAGCIGGAVLLCVAVVLGVYIWNRRRRVTGNRRTQVPLDDKVGDKNGKSSEEADPLKLNPNSD